MFWIIEGVRDCDFRSIRQRMLNVGMVDGNSLAQRSVFCLDMYMYPSSCLTTSHKHLRHGTMSLLRFLARVASPQNHLSDFVLDQNPVGKHFDGHLLASCTN